MNDQDVNEFGSTTDWMIVGFRYGPYNRYVLIASRSLTRLDIMPHYDPPSLSDTFAITMPSLQYIEVNGHMRELLWIEGDSYADCLRKLLEDDRFQEPSPGHLPERTAEYGESLPELPAWTAAPGARELPAPEYEDSAYDSWWLSLSRVAQWSHCGQRSAHEPHGHDITFNEGTYRDVPCPGTPNFKENSK